MQQLRNLPIAAPQRPEAPASKTSQQHGSPLMWVLIAAAALSIISGVVGLLHLL